MNRLLDVGLEQLTTLVFKMGEVAETAIISSIRGFMNQKDTTEGVFELSEILGEMSADAETKAFELIVKYQPVASDLRIINSYIKIAYDFERYGRYAWDISSTQRRFAASRKCVHNEDLMEKMVDKTLHMVRKSIEALRDN